MCRLPRQTTHHLPAQISAPTMVAEKSELWVFIPTNQFLNPFKAKNTQKPVLKHIKTNLATQ
jgi:hypothetical protein